MQIGVLALQGDYFEHQEVLERLGIGTRLVKHSGELTGLAGLIIPGGESTTMLKLMVEESLVTPITQFVTQGGALYGTCAGAILLAKTVSAPAQQSLGFLDISIERNGYGRQTDSHISYEPCPELGETPLEMVFIRAPVIREVANNVQVLASHQSTPVFVRHGKIMATTFHPELSTDDRVHRYFVEKVI
jgi:5'-phosphate synthase pdxT subunit